MRMGVDEPRDQDVLRELYALVIGKSPRGLCKGEKLLDDAIAYRDRVVLENRARRLDRDDPAGADKEAYLGVPWTSTTTRRLGLRHSIRPLRSFWSGQDLTGSVLPKPRVSTFAWSTPFDTR
jgi:hypothetical protein